MNSLVQVCYVKASRRRALGKGGIFLSLWLANEVLMEWARSGLL